MGTPARDLLAGLHLPGHDNAVRRTTREDIGIGAPGEVGDAPLMLTEGVEFSAVISLPDEDVTVAIRSREEHAIGTKVRASHPFGVLRDEEQLLAVGDVEALHLFGVGGDDDLAMVGRDISRHHLVELLANLGDALSRLDVPDDGMPNLAAAAATHDEQRTVRTELQGTSIALRVWEDPSEVVCIGVVEQDLLLARNGEQRGPGAGRHRGDRRGARGDDDGLEQHVLWTRHGAGRLACAASESQVNLGLVGFLGDTALGLEHPAGNPLGK